MNIYVVEICKQTTRQQPYKQKSDAKSPRKVQTLLGGMGFDWEGRNLALDVTGLRNKLMNPPRNRIRQQPDPC